MVIVEDEKEKRVFWKLGFMMSTTVGRDSQVRGAVVKVCPGGQQCKLMRRSV